MITDLDTGGAEMMLLKLLSSLDPKQFLCRVVCLDRAGVLSCKFEQLGIQVTSLNLKPQIPNPMAVFKTIQIMKRWNPDVVQTWLYHADLLGTFASRIAGRGVLLWNVRCTNMDFSHYGRRTLWVMKACAVLSRFPYMILANSHASVEYHRKMGYAARRMRVIPNGFDLDHLKFDPLLRGQLREELKIPETAPCIGLVARFDPMKDHATFFSAAETIASKRPDAHFVLCGEGVTRKNPELRACLGNLKTASKLHLLGHREDISRIMAGLDLFVLSSSFGESFPNVIGEAMSCGIPCVVTDVGDSSRIVADTGRVVSPGNPHEMAGAVLEILELPADKRHELGESARKRIRRYFSLDQVVKAYERVYKESVMYGNPRGRM